MPKSAGIDFTCLDEFHSSMLTERNGPHGQTDIASTHPDVSSFTAAVATL